MSKTRLKSRRWMALVAVVALAGAAVVYGRGPGGWFGPDESTEVEGAPVRRGPLSITVTERGNLEAKDAVSLKCEVEGRTTILSLVEEGTQVVPGQVLAELDSSSLLERQVGQQDRVLNARATRTKAQASLEIQETENESLIARAEQTVLFAETDLEKYIKGDWPQQQQQSDEDILLAEEELANAKDQFEWSEELHENGFLTRTELDRDELSYNRAKIFLEQRKRAKDLMIQYEHPKQLAKLRGDLEEAQRELKKVNLQAVAQIVDTETAVQTSEARLKLEEKELAKIEDQLEKAVIRAPVAGMVVYGREEGGRMRGSEPVQEGGEVRERQEVISIPRSGGMVAKASIHESVLKQVQVGQEVIVRVDAVPAHEFRGRVEYVAMLPDQNAWWANPNLRLYKVEISIADEGDQMRPGMSCNVEILVDQLADTLYVPLQSVLHSGGRNICFVKDGSRVEVREVEIGPHNSKWVAVEKGVREGELVLLSPPQGHEQEEGEAAPEGEVGPPRMPGPDGGGMPAGERSRMPGGERTGMSGGQRAGMSGMEGRMPGREGGRQGGGGPGAEGDRPAGSQRDPSAARGERPSPGERPGAGREGGRPQRSEGGGRGGGEGRPSRSESSSEGGAERPRRPPQSGGRER